MCKVGRQGDFADAEDVFQLRMVDLASILLVAERVDLRAQCRRRVEKFGFLPSCRGVQAAPGKEVVVILRPVSCERNPGCQGVRHPHCTCRHD